MKITLLGTGTSTGVPEIGCQCKVCTSKDSRDNRLRTSAVVETEGKRILIDCGPDFRWQMIKHKIYNLDAVLLTHEHYDHVGGLDDLRPFCKEGAVDVYAEDNVLEAIRTRMPYAFRVPHFKGVPDMELHSVKIEPFEAAGIRIVPVRIWHSPHLPILGYRIGNMAYLTDVKYIPEEEMHKLEGLDLLVIDALRKKPHPTHQTVDEAIKHVRRLKPRLTYFIHMSHHLGLHAEVENELPQDIHLAYDGACIEI